MSKIFPSSISKQQKSQFYAMAINFSPPKLDQQLVLGTGNFLLYYLNFGYYTLTVPYKIVYNGEYNKVQFNRNIFQQVGFFIATSFYLFQYAQEIRSFPYERLNDKPSEYFKWFQKIVGFLYHMTIPVILWRDRARYERLFNYIIESLSLIKVQMYPKITTIAICLFYTIAFLLCQIFGFDIVPEVSAVTPTSLLTYYVASGRYYHFVTNDANVTEYAEKINVTEISEVDIFLATLTFAEKIWRNFFAYYSDGIMLFSGLLLWGFTYGFFKSVRTEIMNYETEKKINVAAFLKSYKALKKLSQLMNDAGSLIVMFFVLENMTFFSINLNAIFVAKDWLKRMRLATLLVNCMGFFIISGDICKRVDVTLEWLSISEASDAIKISELAIMLNEHRLHQVGISGHTFVLDYSSMFNIVGVLITYFIICAQDS